VTLIHKIKNHRINVNKLHSGLQTDR